MLGSLRRLTLVTLLVLLAPTVLAAAPVSNLPSGFSLGGQDVTDVAMDPSGQYVVGVVVVDPANLVTLPNQARHDDIYPCQFGPPSSAFSGSGCRSPGLQHASTRRATTLGARQAVDYTSYTSGGLVARYAVAGPGDTLSLWSSISDTPQWEFAVPGNQAVVNVSLSPDAGRVLAATLPPSGAGRILMYNGSASSGSSGVLLWDYNLSDTRPSSMDYARSGAVAAVGTTAAGATETPEVLVLKPTTRRPILGQEIHRFSAAGDVNHVLLSSAGDALVVGTAQGVHYVPVDPGTGKPADIRSFTQLPGGAQRVALSLDGERFAAASGSKVFFFRFLGGTLISERVGTEFDAGATVADLAYDATGDLLVAIAGNRVYGFGTTKSTPIWSFDATESGNGGLDGPLRKVLVSDGGERIVVAGRTKLMPYRATLAATASFTQAQRMEVTPASNVQLSVTLTNKGSLPDNYTFGARFPPGWNGFSPGPVRLDPEESTTVNFTLDVPAGQAPGFYGVEVDVRSETAQRLGRDRNVVASPALNLTVPRSIVLNLTTADDRVPPLRQGSSVTVPVILRNRGNAEGLVNLSATQVLSRGAPWALRFDNEQVSVPAGGERTVNLIVDAPADAASGDRNDITVCAREGQPRACQAGDASGMQATKLLTAYVDPKFGAELSTNASTFEFGPGELKVLTVAILNTGNTDDSFNLTATLSPAGVQNDWHVTLEREVIKIARGEKRSVTVTVRAAVNDPRDASLIVKAISIGSALTEDGSLTVSLVPRPPAAEEDDKSFLPMPPIAALLGLVAVAALLRRRGGR